MEPYPSPFSLSSLEPELLSAVLLYSAVRLGSVGPIHREEMGPPEHTLDIEGFCCKVSADAV